MRVYFEYATDREINVKIIIIKFPRIPVFLRYSKLNFQKSQSSSLLIRSIAKEIIENRHRPNKIYFLSSNNVPAYVALLE